MADENKVLMINYEVSIKGKKLTQEQKESVQSLTMENTVDGADTLTLAINDMNFEYLEDSIFIEETKVHAKLNWLGSTHVEEFDGYISAIDINFPEEGAPVLSISCIDKTHKMNRKKKTRTWENTTRADVVKKIAKEHGFKCKVQSGYKFETLDTITQSDQTDIEFCESLAGEETYPFECNLIGDTLYYVKRGVLNKSKATLGYRTYPFNVLSFSPKINKETRKEEISASSINGSDKSTSTYTANDKNTKSDTQGDPVKTGDSKQKGMEYVNGKWVPTKET